MADLVYGGAAAIGFVETARRFAGLQDVFAHDTLVVVVSPRNPWAQTPRPITVHDLHTARLVVREEGSDTRDTLGDAMARHALTLRRDLVLGSTTAIKMAVALDEGVGVLSELAVSPEVRDGRLVTLPTDMRLSRTIRAIWPASHEPTGAAGDLLAIARSRH